MTTAQLKAAATGQSTPAQARDPFTAFESQLQASKAKFLPLFGQSMQNVETFIRVVLNAVLANPDLLDADRRSLISSCMKAAQDGLLPDGREAVLNIYNTKISKRGEPDRWMKMVQYLPMVGGFVKMLYASPEVDVVDAACVFEKDLFSYRRGDNPGLDHEPTSDDEPGRIIAAYVIIDLKSGKKKREVMFRRDIEAVRAASKSSSGPAWSNWYDQMAIKSVIKRSSKLLPRVDAFERVMASDNEALGFAGTPDSVAEIVAANAAGTAPGSAPPALEHSPPDPFDFGDAAEVEAEPVPVYAHLADRVLKAKNADEAREALDVGRALPEDQGKQLGDVFARKWGEAS